MVEVDGVWNLVAMNAFALEKIDEIPLVWAE